MIIRVFRARIRPDKVVEFKRMVQEQSIPWLTSTKSMLGYSAGEPLGTDEREFVMVTLWQDVESLKRFVGENWQTPIVTAEEAPLVEEMLAYTTNFSTRSECTNSCAAVDNQHTREIVIQIQEGLYVAADLRDNSHCEDIDYGDRHLRRRSLIAASGDF